MEKPSIALILAAGRGTRLIPMTNEMPKCLVKVLGKNLLTYQLEAIQLSGIKDVIIVVGYHGTKIVDFIESEGFNKKLNFTFVENKKFDKTASCYSLWLSKEHLKNSYIHLNSDLIFQPELLLKLIADKRNNGIITSKNIKVEKDMVRFVTKGERIVKLGKYSEIQKANGFLIGPAKFSSSAAKVLIDHIALEISQGILNNANYLAFGKILDKIRFYSISAEDYFWKEIDTLEDIKKAGYLLEKLKMT